MKEVPRNLCQRLSNNSGNKEILDKIKPPYEEALRHSGHEGAEIKFMPKEKIKKVPKESKSKQVLFCNLPWNMALKTNIGKEFLSLIDMFKNTP